jgi:hypothetical protein
MAAGVEESLTVEVIAGGGWSQHTPSIAEDV